MCVLACACVCVCMCVYLYVYGWVVSSVNIPVTSSFSTVRWYHPSASDGSRQLASKWTTTPLHWAVSTESVGRRTRCSHPVSYCSMVGSIDVSEDPPWRQQQQRLQRPTRPIGVSGLRCAVARRPGPRQSDDRRHNVIR